MGIRQFHNNLAINFSYRSQETAIYCKDFISRNKQNQIQFNMMLFSQVLDNIRYKYI